METLHAGSYPCGPQGLVEEMSRHFGLMRDSRDGSTCESLVHNQIFAAFQRMYAAAKAGDAAAFRLAHNNFASTLMVPYIQARGMGSWEGWPQPPAGGVRVGWSERAGAEPPSHARPCRWQPVLAGG